MDAVESDSEGEPQRELRSDRVHQALLDQILSGRLKPGEAVDSERSLSESYGVNRHAVREAMKRLQQARLVETSQGGATRVADWRRAAGLDLLVELTARPDPSLIRAVVEARRSIGVDAARAFAERVAEGLADDSVLKRMATLADDPPADGTDPLIRRGRYIGMWDTIVDGSGSLPYRLAYNSLIQGSAALILEMSPVFEPEESDRSAQLKLIEACTGGNRVAAISAALALLDSAVSELGGSPIGS